MAEVDLLVTVEVTVNNPDAIARCVENHDDQGVPQPDTQGGNGWRNKFYDIRTEDEVLNHFAYVCVNAGYEDASRLDGWADLQRGEVTMSVKFADPESITR